MVNTNVLWDDDMSHYTAFLALMRFFDVAKESTASLVIEMPECDVRVTRNGERFVITKG